jgi:hypothetical protein
MKLRIRGDSIRLRLTQTETRMIAEGIAVKETTSFPGGKHLTYMLSAEGRAKEIGASFGDHQLVVTLPFERAQAWALGNDVSLRAAIPLQRGGVLSILVEKDFACLKGRETMEEDESDMFPNPNEAHGHCT